MIVVCSTCQARFKVADEKIGARGAKVRCSKCQTVFIVHKELGVIPPAAQPPQAGGLDLDLEGAQRAGVRPNGFSADPYGRVAQAPQGSPAADPYGAADPFREPADSPSPATAADPFTAPDPFTDPSGGGFGAVDPFVASVEGGAPGLPTSAVTDLSDLLGSVAPPAPPSEGTGVLDSGFDFDSPAGSELGLEVEPRHATPTSSGDMGGAGADLALDERTPPPSLAAAPMPAFGDFGGADPFEEQGAASPAPAGHGDFDEPAGPPEAAPPGPAPRTRQPFAAVQTDGPADDAGPRPEAAVETTGEAEPAAGAFRQNSRLRMIAVNAISLVALLAVALGLLALWRGLSPGAGGLFRPTAVLGAIGGEAERFVTSELRSGVYDRPDAPPLIFVSGTALSHAPAPVAALRVRVELVRRGAVVARGEARAGVVLTPEELNTARDGAALTLALERLATRAPASVKPGESVPFLVAIADFPPDAVGASLRVALEPLDAQAMAPALAPDAAPDPSPAAPAATPAAATPEGAKRP